MFLFRPCLTNKCQIRLHTCDNVVPLCTQHTDSLVGYISKKQKQRCCKEPQFIVKSVPRIALEQEETGSNKAIDRARRLV